MNNKEIIAFLHIAKAGGTTLNNILRNNFTFRYCDIKPLSKASERRFRANDLKMVLRINPFVKCIAGHSIIPYVDISETFPEVRLRYITLLRDPVKRSISQYQYWVEKMNQKLTFEEFMGIKNLHNEQTKRIAGIDDLSKAKRIIKEKFLLVGILEEFDVFLLLLKKKLNQDGFKINYIIKNKGNHSSAIRKRILDNFEKYEKMIIERNRVDIELYRYVKDEVLPLEKEMYGSSFEKDLQDFRNSQNNLRNMFYKIKFIFIEYADKCLKYIYYEPIFRIIRKINGLPAKGSF